MTKGHRTVVALLAAVAVLLGLNLFSGAPEAEAQVETGITGSCCLPHGCVDGTDAAECAALGGAYNGDGISCSTGAFCPTVVSISTTQVIESGNSGGTRFWRVFRLWSDGHVDSTVVPFAGGPEACDIGAAGTLSLIHI